MIEVDCIEVAFNDASLLLADFAECLGSRMGLLLAF